MAFRHCREGICNHKVKRRKKSTKSSPKRRKGSKRR